MSAARPFPAKTEAALRLAFGSSEDDAWVLAMAESQGWRTANRAYLAAMRRRGAEEMAALMEAAAIGRPAGLDDARHLLETAISFWSSRSVVKPLHHKRGDIVLEVRVVNCPVYARLQETGWHRVTACGNWHRRQGWYDALDVTADDTLLREKKWGYGACVARVRLREADPVPRLVGPSPASAAS